MAPTQNGELLLQSPSLMDDLPSRKRLPHTVPQWVPAGSFFFITINCEPRGQNHLCRAGPGDTVLAAAAFYHEKFRWHCRLLLLMPDHLHGIIAVPPEPSLKTTVTDWKKFLARNHGVFSLDCTSDSMRLAVRFKAVAAERFCCASDWVLRKSDLASKPLAFNSAARLRSSSTNAPRKRRGPAGYKSVIEQITKSIPNLRYFRGGRGHQECRMHAKKPSPSQPRGWASARAFFQCIEVLPCRKWPLSK